MAQNKLSILPVVDSENNYQGCITLSNLVRVFSETASLKDIGSVITLELNINDYSISEIGKIIESDDAKILSLYVTSSPDTTKMELTIKVNKTDVSRILQTFFRFNYIVTASYQQSDYEEDIKKRYEAFMRYLNT
jgi:CBS domain-containing protein